MTFCRSFCRSCGLPMEPTTAVQSCRCGTPGAAWSPAAPTPEPTFRPGDWVELTGYQPLGSPRLVYYVGRALAPGYVVVSDTGDADDTRVVPTRNLKGTQ